VIFNFMTRGDILMLAEGLDLFRVEVPESLVGKTVIETSVREKTGCTVIAIDDGKKTTTLPDPNQPLERNTEMIMIGNAEAERQFLELYGNHAKRE